MRRPVSPRSKATAVLLPVRVTLTVLSAVLTGTASVPFFGAKPDAKPDKNLKNKVLKGFTYNKVVRRKTKAISKYLDKININKLSENEAKELLKQFKIKLNTVAYSYSKEVFY